MPRQLGKLTNALLEILVKPFHLEPQGYFGNRWEKRPENASIKDAFYRIKDEWILAHREYLLVLGVCAPLYLILS